jgi:C-terminal processing protease CtpA/Prc
LTPCQFTVKRSDSYDGLGLLISADAETRLNHRIREVELSSPADQAGLRKNDRIIAVNGVNVENVEFSDVLILIKQGLNNDSLQLLVVHDLTLI